MNKLEASLLEKLFDGETPIRRAVFCTYGFDPEYFAEVIYPELQKRRCERTLILMDADQYQSIPASDSLNSMGRVVIERSPAGQLFHPKVYVLAGNGRTRASVGSANLTRAGFENNWELFTTFSEGEYDLGRLIEWLDIVAKQSGLGASAKKILYETTAELRAAELGKPKPNPLPMVWNGLQGPRLWQQLSDATQGKNLKKAVILSPYFEAPEAFDHGLLDNWLAQGMQVELYASIDGTHSQTPRDELQTLSNKYPGHLKLFGLPTQGHLLHGKLIVVMDRSQAWVLSGSANFTAAALKGRNIETALLLKLPRADMENYLRRLLPDARPIQPSDLPTPQVIPPPLFEGRIDFLIAATLSLRSDRLTLEMNRPWSDLAKDPGTLYIDLGGQSQQLSETSFHKENTVVVYPASKYLRLSDKTWQLGTIIMHSRDNKISDWRLIELAEGEMLEENGIFTDKPMDFEMFIATLLNPRRRMHGISSNGVLVVPPNENKSDGGFEDVEGELDRVYRLAIQLESHFSWVMTDPYTIHRWRSDWMRFHHLFSTELMKKWDGTMRAYICTRMLNKLEACLSRDSFEARRLLKTDKEFTASVCDLIQAASSAGHRLEVPVLLKSLPAEKV
jgi:hypothetical protein